MIQLPIAIDGEDPMRYLGGLAFVEPALASCNSATTVFYKEHLPSDHIGVSNTGPPRHAWVPHDRSPYMVFVTVRAKRIRTCNMSARTRCAKKAPSSSSNFLAKGGLVRIRRGKARVAFRVRCRLRHHRTTNTEYRLSAVISDRGRILGLHTFPNRIRNVLSLNQGDHIPSIALPLAIETSAIQVDSNGCSARDSLCLVPAQPPCTPAQSSLPNPFPRTSYTTDGSELPLLFHVNPKQGSTTGGDEICLVVKDLPSNVVLYARFGDNITPTYHIADGVLSCCLPAAARPGVVNVTLCQAPSVHEDSYGKSTVSFEYEGNTSKAAALLPKLLDGTPPTQAMLLMLFMHGLPNRGTQEPTTQLHSRPINSEASALPESAFLEILSTLKSLPDFQQRLSRVNEHHQSLLHMAIHLRYRELVHRLVDWGIDLNIKDVNGFTALHIAYLCGDASITYTLERHNAVQLSLDVLGRPPIELVSGYTKTAEGCNRVIKSVWQLGHPCCWADIQKALQDRQNSGEEIEKYLTRFFECNDIQRFRCVVPVEDGKPGQVCGWEGTKNNCICHISEHFGYKPFIYLGQCGPDGCFTEERHKQTRRIDTNSTHRH